MEPTIARSPPAIAVTRLLGGRPTACAWPTFPTPTANSKSTFAGWTPARPRVSLILSKPLTPSPGRPTAGCSPSPLSYCEVARTSPTCRLHLQAHTSPLLPPLTIVWFIGYTDPILSNPPTYI